MLASLLVYVTLGLLLIVTALIVALIAAVAYIAKNKKLPPAFVVTPGAAAKLVATAMTGNVDALLQAAVDSFHLHLADGSLQEKLLQSGLAEVQRSINTPGAKTPVIDAIAAFTGKTRQQVFDTIKAELDGPAAPSPATPPAAPLSLPVIPVATGTIAGLLLLCLTSAASADTWGMPVTGPQRFYESAPTLRRDEPLMRDARGQLVPFVAKSVSYVRYATGDSVQPPEGSYYTPAARYYTNCGGNRRGWHPGKIVSAPFRLFGHRRFRPLGRLFGRC